MPRTLSPYEHNQLAKHGFQPSDLQAAGEMPVEYLTGHVDFYSHDFFVSNTVLIPRVETEELVSLAINHVSESSTNAVSLLEIGTGSGALGLSTALGIMAKQKKVTLTLSDISAAALAVVKKNAAAVLPADFLKQVTFIESDVWATIPRQPFDLVLANLPYIPTARLAKLDSSVVDFEPTLALDGGDDGFEVIARFLKGLTEYLADNGTALLEVDETHTESFFRPWQHQFHVTLHKDSFGKHRFVQLQKLQT